MVTSEQARVALGVSSRGAVWIGESLNEGRRSPAAGAPLFQLSDICCSPRSPVLGTWGILVWASLSLAMLLLLRASVVETFYVPSGSMSPTIAPEQHLVVPNITYGVSLPFFNQRLIQWSAPQRGDVVVFRRGDDPTTAVDEGARAMVKRVVAVGGDTVEIAGTEVFINGERIALAEGEGGYEEMVAHLDTSMHSRRSLRVPPDSLFVLGDNREHSYDSRYWADPFVPVAKVVGPVIGVY